jgi:hypothetical protein
MDLHALPAGDWIEQGLRDLAEKQETVPALLVAIGATRLRELGVKVPTHQIPMPEHRLYELLARDSSDAAHSRYNALIRRLVSFERALACAK